MITFNRHIRTALTTASRASVLGLLTCAQADVIELNHGDLLTGSITDLNRDGVTMTSPLSVSPLQIKADTIKNITFESQKETDQKHREQITLSSGDTLPCNVISLDQDHLKISTWYAGEFAVPRKHLRSLQFGVTENKTIYEGNDDPSAWESREGRWSHSERGYNCQGTGTLARSLKLPQNLSIHFDLAWNTSPNFVFRFCGNNDKANTASDQDSYELSYNSAGLQIRRYLDGKKATLTSIDLPPHEIETRKLGIELQINRELGKLTLLLDGVERGTYMDTFDTPEGNFIILNNRSSQGHGFYIGNLQIRQWRDGSKPRYRAKRTDNQVDILIDTTGEQISGNLSSITQVDDQKRIVQMDVKHSTKPLRVPSRRISTLLFSEPEDLPKPPPSHYAIELVGGGSIQLEAPQLANGKITTQHHILGSCTIDTSAVSRIVQLNPAQ